MAEQTKHMIQIETAIYDELKEFCDLNNLKISPYINQLIKSGLMIDKYGDTPFAKYEVPEPPKYVPQININGDIYDEASILSLLNSYAILQNKFAELEEEFAGKQKLIEELIANKDNVQTEEKPPVKKTEKTTTKRTVKHRLK